MDRAVKSECGIIRSGQEERAQKEDSQTDLKPKVGG
jgi:hypothetical protein